MNVDVGEVARLLAESRAAHEQYRHAVGNLHTPTMEAALHAAYQARCRAEELDPQQQSGAWASDLNALGHKIPHTETLEFYQQELKKLRG